VSREIRDVTAADGNAYRLVLAIPPGAAPQGGWPVAYVLGDDPLQRLLDYAESKAGGARDCPFPQAILVGIGYPGDTRRELDYTPNVELNGELGLSQPPDTGGAQRFLAFIQSELQPMVASLHSVDTRRQVLMGHSFGGLFVVDTLLKQPNAFFAYVSSSASVWWADRYLEKMARHAASSAPGFANPPGIWMSVGEYEQSASPQEIERNDSRLERTVQRRESRRMVDGNRDLSDLLTGMQAGNVRFKVVAGETHGNVVGPALYWGLQGALGNIPQACVPSSADPS
jgi:predicted alpha/beta superfamily hydrolase